MYLAVIVFVMDLHVFVVCLPNLILHILLKSCLIDQDTYCERII